MNRYLLDTNICIAWLQNQESVVQRIVQAGEGHIWLCTPVKAELAKFAQRPEKVKIRIR